MMKLTVDPGVRHKNSALWQLQLGNLGLDALVLQHGLLDGDNLLSITRSVDERAKTDIALDPVGRQVDGGLVEFILQVHD